MVPFSTTGNIKNYSPKLNDISVCSAYDIEVLAVFISQGCTISRGRVAQASILNMVT
jgi:hypothetical protein